MFLITGFESNTYVEIALEEIKDQCNITDEQISFVEMKPQVLPRTFFDSIHSSDGFSILDSMAAWAVVGGVLGIIYGSRIWLGSILLGLLGFITGCLLGFIFDKLIHKTKKERKIRHIEILLVIKCNSKDQVDKAAAICKKNNVLSLGIHQ